VIAVPAYCGCLPTLVNRKILVGTAYVTTHRMPTRTGPVVAAGRLKRALVKLAVPIIAAAAAVVGFGATSASAAAGCRPLYAHSSPSFTVQVCLTIYDDATYGPQADVTTYWWAPASNGTYRIVDELYDYTTGYAYPAYEMYGVGSFTHDWHVSCKPGHLYRAVATHAWDLSLDIESPAFTCA
jgi:hypothetical protein